jgi:uncharacterized membrane protein YqaE (UPF0057 family)
LFFWDGTGRILIIVAVIFPPAAALFVTGCGCDLLINILLTMYVLPNKTPSPFSPRLVCALSAL